MRRRIRSCVKGCLPSWCLLYYRRLKARRLDVEYQKLTLEGVFEKIYLENRWGGKGIDYFSGRGSHEHLLVTPYLKQVSAFLRTLPRKPIIVDLGCGDFNVGKELVPLSGNYIACDIVPGLIERNKKHFEQSNVDWRVVNIVDDRLPLGDIALIRNVFQHLSNSQVHQVLSKVGQYSYLLITEHAPNEVFTENIDKFAGSNIRYAVNSAVNVTSPPFNLKVKSEKILCDTVFQDGKRMMRTILYELA